MKLRKLKTKMLHLSHFRERDKAELAILRDPATTWTRVADPGLHLSTVKQNDSLGQTKSPPFSGYTAMRE